MTIAEQVAIERLNDIQLKIATAMGRILAEQEGIERAVTILTFAKADLDRILEFLTLGEAPLNDTQKT